MSIFITGATGYIGAHITANLLQQSNQKLSLLVRAKNSADAENRMWRALQLHMSFEQFHEYLQQRLQIVVGDLTAPRFGYDDYDALVRSSESIIHCAASLNRKSERSCLNVNLRGTLQMLQFAKDLQSSAGLRRFSHLSTVAVAGERQNEVVGEDASVDWNRRDYDPYARTKKFSELMVQEWLGDASWTIFRPSIVLGDSRYPQTTQFEMVRAFAWLARMPILPYKPNDQIDIVPVEFVADAVSYLHQKESPQHRIYHLSGGRRSQSFRELTDALATAQKRMKPMYMPMLERPFAWTVNSFANSRFAVLRYPASLMKVFHPYLIWNTVFDNTRVTTELGRHPAIFSEYCYPLLQFGIENKFEYRYEEWPTQMGHVAG